MVLDLTFVLQHLQIFFFDEFEEKPCNADAELWKPLGYTRRHDYPRGMYLWIHRSQFVHNQKSSGFERHQPSGSRECEGFGNRIYCSEQILNPRRLSLDRLDYALIFVANLKIEVLSSLQSVWKVEGKHDVSVDIGVGW